MKDYEKYLPEHLEQHWAASLGHLLLVFSKRSFNSLEEGAKNT